MMMIISTIARAVSWLILWVVLIATAFFVYAYIEEYSPKEVESILVVGDAQPLVGDTVVVVSWNIGYAGLGADMDFFMDGGRSVQTSRGRTELNLRKIVSFLADSCRRADFILLQEVDRGSKRTYDINEYDTLSRYFGRDYRMFFAPNFITAFVPIPIGNPIGDVNSGLVTMSRVTPRAVERFGYPGGPSWPNSMFDLKRCMLSLNVSMGDSLTLYVNNTHNSAYDQGGKLREGELAFLRDYLSGKPFSITAGDWNSNPPMYSASQAEVDNQYFSPMKVEKADFDSTFHFAADVSTYSVRYGDEPYDSLTTTRSVIDFALSSARVVPIDVRCVDLGFESSDHNPVIFKFLVKKR